MSSAKKSSKVPGYMRVVLAANVSALLERHSAFRDLKNVTEKQRALAKQAGTSLSTIQRIMAKQVGPSSDIIEQVAGVFDISPYQLMLPNLDPANPQVVSGASAAERRLYQEMKRHHMNSLKERST